METLANLEGAQPVTPLCSVVGSPSQQLSDLALARTPVTFPAAWLLEAVPPGEALGVQQELADKATGADSYMFRGCFQLSAGDCAHGGASSTALNVCRSSGQQLLQRDGGAQAGAACSVAAWLSGGQSALKMLRNPSLSGGGHTAFWQEAADR